MLTRILYLKITKKKVNLELNEITSKYLSKIENKVPTTIAKKIENEKKTIWYIEQKFSKQQNCAWTNLAQLFFDQTNIDSLQRYGETDTLVVRPNPVHLSGHIRSAEDSGCFIKTFF